jgi:hypothetical protein
MPKTTMDENHLFASWKNDVGTAGKRFDVQTVAISKPMQKAADCAFRTGVAGLYGLHDPAALFRRSGICHRALPNSRERNKTTPPEIMGKAKRTSKGSETSRVRANALPIALWRNRAGSLLSASRTCLASPAMARTQVDYTSNERRWSPTAVAPPPAGS